MEVSVHATEEAQNNITITLTRKVGKKEFSVLMDSLSTRRFQDEKTSSRLRRELAETTPMKVVLMEIKKLASMKDECFNFNPKIGQ